MESIDDPWWNSHFRPGKKGEPDYVSLDGLTLIEQRTNYHGIRGLHADMMRLATMLEEKPAGTRAGLVIRLGRISSGRLREAWESGKAALRPELARRLFVVVVDNDDTWTDPQRANLEEISRVFSKADHETGQVAWLVRPSSGHKYYEILKVLLLHWLYQDGPQPLGKIAEEVGCTYPTIREALRRPLLKKYIRRNSTREVELSAFPLQAWQELVALAATHRQTMAFVDSTRSRPTPDGLKKRIQRLNREDIAFGGAISARFWHKTFDLHGTPRLDVSLHVSGNQADVGFVHRIDPALKISEDLSSPAALVIHPIFRAKSFFGSPKRTSEAYADPIETALDLYEVGLNTQAFELLRSFRPEVRLS